MLPIILYNAYYTDEDADKSIMYFISNGGQTQASYGIALMIRYSVVAATVRKQSGPVLLVQDTDQAFSFKVGSALVFEFK